MATGVQKQPLCVAILAIALGGPFAKSEAADAVSFNRDVRPILSENCFQCHGPDVDRREADLRLDEEQSAKESVIVPGDPDASELIRRILTDDPDERMPPAASKLSLTDQQKQVLQAWVAQGADWNAHWAFAKRRPVKIPRIANAAWPRNAVDHFVLAGMEPLGLEPSGEASRETLIRRVTFDLTGLPPQLAEIDRFVNDESPEAYERVVDRLLESPHFGERLAADWLDAARYSDTYGYQVDRDRYVWPWRDWVISAFNRALPFDEFVTRQLAGDLLPNATPQTVLATTFNRLHPQKVEGGSVPEEFRLEYVADRTQTFATALLGLTMECCRCHSHKYDPLTQREYYELSAFFDNIDEAGLYSYFTPAIPTPTLLLPTDDQQSQLEAARREVERAEFQLKDLEGAQRAAFERWREDEPQLTSLLNGQVAHLDFEQPDSSPNKSVPGRDGLAVQLTGDDGIKLDVGNFHRYQPFSVSLWLSSPDNKQRAVVYHRSGAWTDAASRGYELLLEDGRLSAALVHFWPGNAIRVVTRDPLPTQTWLHATVTWDGSSRAAGLRIYLNGQLAPTEIVRDKLIKQITGGGGDTITIGQRFRDRGFTNGLVDEFRVFDRELTALEVAHLYQPINLQERLIHVAYSRAIDDSNSLYTYYLHTFDNDFREGLKAVAAARQRYCELADQLDEIMVMRELPERRPTYIRKRGAYDAPGDLVAPGTPAVLPPFPTDAPRNRLGLARWLTDPEHPLTARVAVNQIWQLVFGAGLVRTPEDFGSQGQPPTHPELLDWLANDFVASNWDVKRLIRTMVTSSTYRQSSSVSSKTRALDPENRWYARASSYRLSAEMLRDNALAASGLWVSRLGGEPARPYELEVSFKPTNRDRNAGLYRRSLYTYWKRTAPAPVMMTLDAAKREVCRVRRERTSSPLQAFVLLNGPQFVEAARCLSESLMRQHGSDVDAILKDLFRRLTSRRPTEKELSVMHELYDHQLTVFTNDQAEAERYVSVGDAPRDEQLSITELAATTTVANMLFNYDECVNKR